MSNLEKAKSSAWFVTGASSGIGRELIRQALMAGERAVAIARKTADVAQLGPSNAQ
jgi:NADP-dependent 3-hydroxy acid dehydrogenase YdfG